LHAVIKKQEEHNGRGNEESIEGRETGAGKGSQSEILGRTGCHFVEASRRGI
jgi:hypothetical protein